MIRSTYRCRTRDSASVSPLYLSGSGRSAFAVISERVGQDGQLAAPGRDDLPRHAHVVAKVDVLLPGRQCVCSNPVERDHHLKIASAIPECGEAQLAAIAGQHDPASDADHLAGDGVGGQLAELGAHLGDRVRTRVAHRIGVDARRAQPLDLRQPHLHLLGH